MKRRLITGIYLSLATLAACQIEPATDTGTASQEARTAAVDACTAKMPPTPYYDGKPLPDATGSRIFLYYQDAERPGDFVVVLVDTANATIPFGTRTKSSGLGSLLGRMDQKAQWAGGRQPSPPQPVDEWRLAAALVEWANLALPDLGGAVAGGVCKSQ